MTILHADNLFDHAIGYARRGFSVLPVNGKTPACKWRSLQRVPADEMELRRLFAQPKITGIAVITGAVSQGLAVRDFDQIDAYDIWAAANPLDAAKIPTSRTYRAFHVFGRLETETYLELADGELRADSRHYVILPPSAHPKGGRYEWWNALPEDRVPLPLLPPSLTTHTSTHLLRQTHSHTPIHTACVRHSTSQVANRDVLRAVQRTLPGRPGQRNRKVFELARALKGIMPDASANELRSHVQYWHRLALAVIRTKDFTTTWIDFVVAWERVRAPEGDSMAAIITTARTMPPLTAAKEYDTEPMQLLVALCAALHEHHGQGSWPLSCRLAGKVIGVSHDTAARMIKALCFDGVIELVKQAGTKGSGVAAEYKYVATTEREVF